MTDDPVDALREQVLGGPARWTRDEVAAQVGTTVERARTFWRALGFADVGEARVFTDADVAALRRVLALVDSGVLGEETAVGLARALGHTTGRLAAWQTDLLLDGLASASPDGTVTVADAQRLAERLLPDLSALLDHAWRRELAATVDRAVEREADELTAPELTVGFADLVGFTRLARRTDEQTLARLVDTFEQTAADVVAAAGARLVKTLGDEVLFVADEPATAVGCALTLVGLAADGDVDRDEPSRVPELRSGLATGRVIATLGDVYGPTVNLASRLTALAPPGGVLLDDVTAAAVAADPALAVVAGRPRRIRGVGVVRPWRAIRSPRHAAARGSDGR